MCGIVGVINTSGKDDKRLVDFFSDALIAGAVRGTDSTGMFQIEDVANENNFVYTFKEAIDGLALRQSTKTNAVGIIRDSGKCLFTVAHHRAATMGSVKKDNAHPFMAVRPDGTTCVGVHNGTLNFMDKGYKGNNFEVDSEYAVNVLLHEGKKGIEQLHGTMALVWHDTKNKGVIHLYTNGTRPLHFAFVSGEEGKKVLIASEAEMLYWLAARNRLSLQDGEILSCRSKMLYTFNAKEGTDLRKYSSDRLVDGTVYPPVARQHYNKAQAVMPTSTVLEEIKALVGDCLANAAASDKSLPALPAPKGITTRPPSSSPEEARTLVDTLGIVQGTEVVFEGETFYPNQSRIVGGNKEIVTGDLHGIVVLETLEGIEDMYVGCVRNVTSEFAEKWIGRPSVVKALGAFLVSKHGGKKGVDVSVVCTRPSTALQMSH